MPLPLVGVLRVRLSNQWYHGIFIVRPLSACPAMIAHLEEILNSECIAISLVNCIGQPCADSGQPTEMKCTLQFRCCDAVICRLTEESGQGRIRVDEKDRAVA
jgi:hypothetical protein